MQGVLLHAIDGKGNDIYKRAAGTSALGPTSPPISFTNTIRLASCTKLVTTIAALQCVERGLLALDAPLDALLPELCSQPIITSYNAASSAAAASLTFAQRTKPLTLRHLLTHTSGVGYDTLQPALRAHRASRGEAGQTTTPSAAIATAFGVPLLFEPGDGWAYGGGLDWAGVAVERALRAGGGGGGELEDCVQECVFGPLGLRDSTFRLERREGVRERLVEMALKGGGGAVHGVEGVEGLVPAEGAMVGLADPVAECLGGSGLYSSVPDFLALLRDLLAPEPKLLRKETVDQMFEPQMERGGKAQEMLAGNPWMYSSMTGGATQEETEVNFGMGGLLIMSDLEGWGAKTTGTLTWGGNGNLIWFANREARGGDGIAALFGGQVLPAGDADVQVLIKAFLQEVWRRSG
ncbi:hypothetical protein GTA08_BOTSDO03237 [Neofusicoccum parvum]|nr:hypothetical protein GTA08_BOTSDO03237 [Neofusicoccum parvum]